MSLEKHKLDDLHENVPANYYQEAIKKNFFQKYWHTRRFKEIKKLIDTNGSKKRMLDIGCHSGKFTYELSKKLPTTKIFGIDMSTQAIEYAKKKYKKITFKVARAEKLPFKDNYFDIVTCLEVLEHIDHPKLLLKELKRVTKKNGQIIILVPSENLLFKLIWFFWIHFGPGKVWNHTHVNNFTDDKLDNLIKKGGLLIERRKLFLHGMLLAIKATKN